MQITPWLDNFPFWNRQKDRFWQFWWVEVWWLRRQHPGRHNKPQTSRLCKCQTNILIVHLNGRTWNSESAFVLLLFARRQKQRRRRNFWKQDGNVKQCFVTQLQLKHKNFNSKWALFNPWMLQVAPTSWAKLLAVRGQKLYQGLFTSCSAPTDRLPVQMQADEAG